MDRGEVNEKRRRANRTRQRVGGAVDTSLWLVTMSVLDER